MRRIAASACALLLVASVHAQKDVQMPKDLPPYGDQPGFQTPDVKTSKLGNGLNVWLVPQPGLPKVSIHLAVLGGMASDPANRPGLSDLLARTLNQGTATRTARQIAEEIESAGGDLQFRADRDSISAQTSVLSSGAGTALGLLADVVRNAAFPEGEVTLAKRNLISSLEEQESQPYFLAERALAHTLFGKGPYSITAPSRDSVEHTTVSDLRNEYVRRFRPDQTLLIVVGDFDSAKMSAQIGEMLGGWKSPATTPELLNARPIAAVAHQVTLVPRPGSVQTTLLLGGFGPLRGDPDYEAGQVADAIFGSTFSSRLVANIREDKGYTYSPGSFLDVMRQADVLLTVADVRNAVTGASLNEIVYELNRMATTTPTDEELNRARRYLLGSQAVALQERSAVAYELNELWLAGLDPAALAVFNRKVNATTAGDVDAVARKYFAASRMSIVAVGEEKVIRDALAPFALPVQPPQ